MLKMPLSENMVFPRRNLFLGGILGALVNWKRTEKFVPFIPKLVTRIRLWLGECVSDMLLD